jgi:hypothetical protein
MNNNTNHNFTDLFEQDHIYPNHSLCKICGEFSTNAHIYSEIDKDDYMTICENCFDEISAFENKFAKFLGTVKF